MPYYESPVNRYINPFYLEVFPDIRVEMESRAGAYASEVRSTNTKSISWPYQKMPWAHITAYYWENKQRKEFKIGFEEDKIGNLNSNERGKLSLYGEQRNQPKYPLVTGIDISNQGLRGSLLKGKFSFVFFPELTLTGFELETMQRILFTPGNEVQIAFGWSEYAEIPEVNSLEFKGIIYGFNWSFNTNLSISAEVDIVSVTTIALGLSGDQTVVETDQTDIVKLNDPFSTEIKGLNLISVIDKDLSIQTQTLKQGEISYYPIDKTPSKLMDYFAICLPSSEVEELEQIVINITGSDGGGGTETTPTDDGVVEGAPTEGGIIDAIKNAFGFGEEEEKKKGDGYDLTKVDPLDYVNQHFFVQNSKEVNEGKFTYHVTSRYGHFAKQHLKDSDPNKKDGNYPGKSNDNQTFSIPETDIGKSSIIILKVKPNFNDKIGAVLKHIAISDSSVTVVNPLTNEVIGNVGTGPYGNWSYDNSGTFRVLDIQRSMTDFKDSNYTTADVLAKAGFVPDKKGISVTTKKLADYQKDGEQEYYIKIAYMPKRYTKSEKARIAFYFEFYNQYNNVFQGEWVTIHLEGKTKSIERSDTVDFGKQKIKTNSNPRPVQIKVGKDNDKLFSRIAPKDGYYIDGKNASAFSIVKFENNTITKNKETEDTFFIQFSPKTEGDKEAVLRIRVENFNTKGQFQTTTFMEKRLVGRAVKTDAEVDSFESGIKKETDATVDPNATNNTPIETATPDGTTPDGATPDGTAPNGATPDGTTEPIVVRDKIFWYVRLGSLVNFANILVSRFEEDNVDKDLFYSLFTMQAFNNETQYNPLVKSANPIDVFFPDKNMGAYGSIVPFNSEGTNLVGENQDNNQFLRHFGRWNSEKNIRETRVESDVINLGNILIGVDVIKRIYGTFIDDGGKNISFKNITKFFDEILGLVSAATGDIYELTAILFDEPESLVKSKFGYGFSEKRQRAILSIEDTNLAKKVTQLNGVDTVEPFWFDATVIRPLLRNVTVVSRPSKEMAAAAYIAARGGNALISGQGDGAGIVNLDNQLNLGGYTNEKEYRDEYNKTLEEMKTAERTLASSGWNSAWSETYRGSLIKYKRLASGLPPDDVADAHWLNKAIYPIEFSATIDGINGFKFGDVLKTSLIPKHYNEAWDITFTVTKITHKVTPSTWETTLQTAARLSQYAPGYGDESK